MPVLLVSGCSPADEPPTSVAGRLQNAKIDEASGLARSQRYPDVFWVANDDGPSVLYAIDSTGKDLGRVTVKDASNRDWEDLASFTLDGVPYLIAADIGDNEGKRKDVRLYIIEEPEAGDDKVKPAWRIEFTYPEGPRDAESVAVDVDNERVLVLTKRDVPALLYALPLRPGTKKRIDAERLGVVASLPQPSRSDLEFARRTNSWHWQPTSMDISSDGMNAIVLTYGGVYLYPRSPGQDWLEALQQSPLVVSRSSNRQAESVAFTAAGDFVYITLEQRNAPLFRLPARKPAPED
ncbi:MAG: hypothetical protein KJP17_03430 [Gammaproteobacteria bacterium]|nr:hypothetical protein [Gammaproteobacteria bacterium]